MKLRAVHDFDRKQVSKREKMQLRIILNDQGLLTKGKETEVDDSLRGEKIMEYLTATDHMKKIKPLPP